MLDALTPFHEGIAGQGADFSKWVKGIYLEAGPHVCFSSSVEKLRHMAS